MRSSGEVSEERERRKRRVVRGEKKGSENCCDCHGWRSDGVGLSPRDRASEEFTGPYS